MSLTLKSLLQRGSAGLSSIESAALDARLLLEAATGLSREQLLSEGDRTAPPEEIARYETLIARRAGREPIAHILGKKEFWGLDFRVTRDTLIPRPDSETLISTALRLRYPKNRPEMIVDLGTGSGCLLIPLLLEWPDAQGLAVDRNFNALRIARQNAQAHGVDERMQVINGSWVECMGGRFDLIVSNPPYISAEDMETLADDVCSYEPALALSGGEDGLDAYRSIARDAARCLADDGWLALELGSGQAQAVGAMLRENGMTVDSVHRDLAGIERCLVARKN